jgi:ribonuclease D
VTLRRRRLGGQPSTPESVSTAGSEAVDYEWVDNQDVFNDLVTHALSAERIGVDTEFHRERTYWPRVALLQIAVENNVFLVDPLEVDLEPLAAVLDSDVLWVMHASSQDLEVLERACGVIPRHLFDTQIAAGFAGMSTPSLSSLVERYVGHRLPKGDRLTDWFERPLRPTQREYAASDVLYLFELHDRLTADLEQRGRLNWAITESDASSWYTKPTLPVELAWTRIKEARHLRGQARCVASVLAEWRERTAQNKDLPTRFILSDLALVGVAQRAPKNSQDLKGVRGLDGRYLKDRSADEILSVVADGLRRPSEDVPTLDAEEGPKLDKDLRAAVTLVSAWVSQVAKDEALDPALLATRADITDLLRGSKNARLSTGWRADLVGSRIQDLVTGRAAVAFDPRGGLVLEPRVR